MSQASILQEIVAERQRQESKWGEQLHPSGADADLEALSTQAKAACDAAAAEKKVTWLHIAEEEFWEAFCEVDPAKRRMELVQLAAVVVNAIEAHDKTGGK